MRGDQHVSVDLDPRGLQPGRGVQASALTLPFRDASFDVVAAFDVVEHCEPEAQALGRARPRAAAGRPAAAVGARLPVGLERPRRPGRPPPALHPAAAARRGPRAPGSTYDGAATGSPGCSPPFAAERLARRVRRGSTADDSLPQPSAAVERVLLGVSRAEARWLRRRDLPFGSSIFLAGEKPV